MGGARVAMWCCVVLATPSCSSVFGLDDPTLASDAADLGVRAISVNATAPRLVIGTSFTVTVVVRNELAQPATAVAPVLALTEDGVDHTADFRVRNADSRELGTQPPSTIGAGETATYQFVVEPLASHIATAPIAMVLAGSHDGGVPILPLATVYAVAPPVVNAPLVVTTATDGNNVQGSLREAMNVANATSGVDAITFAPGIATIMVSTAVGALPTITDDLIIDGAGTVALAIDPTQADTNHYGVTIASGRVVLHGLELRDFAANYPAEDLSTDNCGNGVSLEGGAIRVDGGNLLLDSSQIRDPAVPERNCFGASIRIYGGAGHRLVGNAFTEAAMDVLFTNAPLVEVADNHFSAVELNSPDRSDEGLYLGSIGTTTTLSITGNVFVGYQYSAIASIGDGGTLQIVNNTFVRCGRLGLNAVRRQSGTRQITLSNNAYSAIPTSAISANNEGIGVTVGHEVTAGGVLCAQCSQATINAATTMSVGSLGLANEAGTTRDDLAPTAASVLVDGASPLLDRNGPRAGWHDGAGADIGAVEIP